MNKIREVARMVHNLRNLKYEKNIRGWNTLIMSTNMTKGVFPAYVQIMSHHTGNLVKFNPIKPEHPKFDQDQWDGEQQIYEPSDLSVVNNSNLILVIHHG